MSPHKSVAAIIPARYQSSRFPGKPLVKLLDKPMVIWVAELTARALGRENVYVATDDERIQQAVAAHGFNVVFTSGAALTGTDRLAEAARQIPAEIYVNVQGDEPTVAPDDIIKVVAEKQRCPGHVVCAMTKLNDDEDPANVNIPKVVANEQGRLLYMSRLPVPGAKNGKKPAAYYKQVCIYAFTRSELEAFTGLGRKSYLEALEDIEILRFFELNVPVQMVKVEGGSYAVDVEEDVYRVENVLRRITT